MRRAFTAGVLGVLLMAAPAIAQQGLDITTTLSSSPDLLFYDWLSELIFLKDTEQLIFTDAATSSPPRRLPQGRVPHADRQERGGGPSDLKEILAEAGVSAARHRPAVKDPGER